MGHCCVQDCWTTCWFWTPTCWHGQIYQPWLVAQCQLNGADMAWLRRTGGSTSSADREVSLVRLMTAL